MMESAIYGTFLRRNYSDDYGKLYKPDNSKLNEFDMNDGNMMERIASILGEDADMTALQSAMADAFAGSSGERGDGTESEDQGSSGASSCPPSGPANAPRCAAPRPSPRSSSRSARRSVSSPSFRS